MNAELAEWQRDNASQVLEQACKTCEASIGGTQTPSVNTGRVTGTRCAISSRLPPTRRWSSSAAVASAGSRDCLLGSVTAGMLHHARCPVVVVRRQRHPIPPGGPRFCWAWTARQKLRYVRVNASEITGRRFKFGPEPDHALVYD